MVPLEAEFGWSRTLISASIAVNIALFGLIGPFAASVMDRWGLRRVVLGALALMAGAVALSSQMSAEWQFFLLWGVVVGAATGVTAMVLAAVVATRWFDARRGLVMGMLSAANATGQLIFLTPLATVVESSSWRSAALIVAAAALIVFVLVWLFMRDRPADLGLRPYGQTADAPVAMPPTAMAPLRALGWRHARAHSGFSPARFSSAARAPMGSSARISSRRVMTSAFLLSARRNYSRSWASSTSSARRHPVGSPIATRRGICCLRTTRCAACLLFLPASLAEGSASFGTFAVFYGLDSVATVPPTVKLTTEAFSAGRIPA